VHTLAVALLGNTTDLASVTAAEASAGVTLCYVGGATREFLAFQTATLTGAAAYNLTNLARALRGSTDGPHASSAPFVRCDQAIVRIPFPAGFPVGTTVFFKFTSFNLYGGNEESLASVTAYPFTFQNIGGPAGGNTVDGIVHTVPVFDLVNDTLTLTNIPTAPTEIQSTVTGATRRFACLTNAKRARLVANIITAAAAGTAIKVSYSTNNGGSWLAIGTTLDVSVGTGGQPSAWFTVPTGMDGDVLLKFETTGGGGTASLELSALALQYSGV
jgi:hypothetical protein